MAPGPPEAGPEHPGEIELLRLFVAVPAPPGVREAAAAAISPLRGQGDVRWVPLEHLHLTLKFFGPTPAGQVPALQEILVEHANTFSRIVIRLAGVGAFPSIRRPRTLWVGIEEGERLAALAEALDEAIHPLGFPRERRAYRAHLTMGRVRSERGMPGLAQRLAEARKSDEAAGAARTGVEWRVEEVCLVRSVLKPSGSEYTVLGRHPLRAEE